MRKRSLVGRASSALFGSTQRRQPNRKVLSLEYLESRRVLVAPIDGDGGGWGGGGGPPSPSYDITLSTHGGPATSFPPALVRNAYHVDEITFQNGTVPGDGSGQTIAIVVAFNHAGLLSDINQFSTQYGLPLFNQPGGPTLTVVNQNGQTSPLPGPAPQHWVVETMIDVTYAHVIAPKANIVVVEAPNDQTANLTLGQAIVTAGNMAPVVSMSFGNASLSSTQINTLNGRLAKAGVTFLAGGGNPGTGSLYPALSPNAVAVGGTVFSSDVDGHYTGETGYVQYFGSASGRSSFPDIAMGAATNVPGVSFPLVFNGQNDGGGGTSLATPMVAGLVAIANQGRALNGQGPIKLSQHSNISAANVRDIISGNGAAPGFDTTTGMGSPRADRLVAAWSNNPVPVPRITDVTVAAQANVGDHILFDTGTNGSVNKVEIWRDTNENNQFDAGDTLVNSNTSETWMFDYAVTGPASPVYIHCIGGPGPWDFMLVAVTDPTTFFIRGQDTNTGAWSTLVTKNVFINGDSGNAMMAGYPGSSTTSPSDGTGGSGTLNSSSTGYASAGATQFAPLASGPSANAAILSYWELTGGSGSGISFSEYESLFADDELVELLV